MLLSPTVRERLLNKVQLYILVAVLVVVGLGLFLYKAFALGFPLKPKTRSQIWNVEARITFVAENKPVKASLFIPSSSARFAVVDEHFVSSGYGLLATLEEGNRKAVWSIRKASDKQSLYYQAVVRAVRTRSPRVTTERPVVTSQPFSGPKLEAAKALIDETWAKSADTPTMVPELIKRLNQAQPRDNATALLGPNPTVLKKVETAVRVLEQAGIPARIVQGISLEEDKSDFSKKATLLQWLEVYHNKRWLSFDPYRGKTPVPEKWLPWWWGHQNLAQVEGEAGST